MQIKHLKYLVCPSCKSTLHLARKTIAKNGRISSGQIICKHCHQEYPIINYIPRFVPLNNYAASFGLQWKKHARTQYDRFNGTTISQERFFTETAWPKKLKGNLLLEVGCGSGRFTEQALSTGAMVISLDYSQAVETNYLFNGQHKNLLIIQADIYNLPLPPASFDKILCIGVLQHTPQVEKSFSCLPPLLKKGGALVIDVYQAPRGIRWLWATKYLVRPFTKRIAPQLLYQLVRIYITALWPLARLIRKIPKIGRMINWKLLIADHSNKSSLPEKHLKEWAILDTFDMLSPQYDQPQSLESVRRWFRENNLKNISIFLGYNGINGRGIKA